MGSGKSTLGAELAATLRATFLDLDARLESESGRSIRDLLQAGEPQFRQLELDLLRRLVEAPPERCVVAAGGGIVETPAAHPLLLQLGTVVWLRADPAECVERLHASRAARPLLDDGARWRERYARREALYASLAQHVVSTHPESIPESLAALERLASPPRAAGA